MKIDADSLKAIYDSLPTEYTDYMIKAAAELSGRPAAELTIEEAVKILGGKNPNPILDAKLDAWAEDTVNHIIGQLPDGLPQEGQMIEELTNLAAVLTDIAKQSVQECIPHEIQEDQKEQELQTGTEIELELLMEAMAEQIGTDAKQAGIAKAALIALDSVMKFTQSDEYKAIKKDVETVTAFLDEHKAEYGAFADASAEIQDIIPFLQMEISEDPRFDGLALSEALKHLDGDLIEKAKQRRANYEQARGAIAEVEQTAKKLPRIIFQSANNLEYPLDKPNSQIWGLLTDAAKKNPNGQIKLAIDTSKKGSKQNAVVLYSINFDELQADTRITKHLTQFDKLVYIAAHALYIAGNDIFTATQIYGMMGNEGKPRTSDLQKINDSLTKMGSARVYIDNTREAEKTKYPLFKYDAPLLPFERITAIINGKQTESAIHLFREPPLITFAKQRNQVTTISRQLLESPVNKTEANLLINDYLLERIGHMQRPKSKAPRKILYTTLYEKCHITTVKQKQRAPEKIKRYLDHYKKCKWIKGYSEDTEGITIQV